MVDAELVVQLQKLLRGVVSQYREDMGCVSMLHAADETTVRAVVRCQHAWCRRLTEALLYACDARALAELPGLVKALDDTGIECAFCERQRRAVEEGRAPGPFGPPPAERATIPATIRILGCSQNQTDVLAALMEVEWAHRRAPHIAARVVATLLEDEYARMPWQARQLWRAYCLLRSLPSPPAVALEDHAATTRRLLAFVAARVGIPGAELEQLLGPTGLDVPADSGPPPARLPPTPRRPDFGSERANPAESLAGPPLVQGLAQEPAEAARARVE